MAEYFGKYRSFERYSTCPTIDDPMIVVMGLTIFELSLGAAVFVLIGMFADAPLIGFVLGILSASITKTYRRLFPKNFAQHFFWSTGYLAKKGVPAFFKKSRFSILEP